MDVQTIKEACNLINSNTSIPNELKEYFVKLLLKTNTTTENISILAERILIDVCSADFPFSYKIVGTLLLLLIGLIGAIGNLLVIYVVFSSKDKNSRYYYNFLSSLAMADFLVLTSTIPLEITYFWTKNEFIFGNIACKLHVYLAFMSINCSAANILVVTFERYKAICYPFRNPTTLLFDKNEKSEKTKKTKKQIFYIWLFNAIYHLPWLPLTAVKNDPNTSKPTCDFTKERNFYLTFFLLDLLNFYIIPLFFSGYMYIKIYQNLFRSFKFSRRSANQICSVTSNNPTDDGCFESDSRQASNAKGLEQQSSIDQHSIRHENLSLNSLNSLTLATNENHENAMGRKFSCRSMQNSSLKMNQASVQLNQLNDEERQDDHNKGNKVKLKLKDLRVDKAMTITQNPKNKHWQITKILSLIYVLFALLLLPYRGLLVYNSFVKEKQLNIWLLLFCKSLISINSMINPILYNLITRKFREGFKRALLKLFCLRRSQKELNHNRQESILSSRT